MTLSDRIKEALKEAMKNKDEARKRTIRAIKSELLLMQTDGSGGPTPDKELKMLQRMVKQRKESHATYQEQGRDDLAATEAEEIAIIEEFLPQQLTAEELETELKAIIEQTGASSPKDMGKVMGLATKKLLGKADGKAISSMVKALLS